jgi:hypothetical protein
MGIIKDCKYKIIKNFLTLEEIKLLRDYCRIKHRINFNSFDFTNNDNGDTYFYGDLVMESLMINKLELMQKETGLELLPTYAYWRMYTLHADLKKHTDRPSCEVSVTVMIGSDGTKWPIYMNGTAVHLEPGEAAIYLGCEVEHWREEFTGDWQAQTFLHYVDKNGPNKEWFKDKRHMYGMPSIYDTPQ